MTDDYTRIHALDFLRGIAVMGILLANMPAFGLPSAAQLSPFTVGTDGPLDMAVWLFNFLLVDGKFRALFALMFGASILLVMESAELDGRDGRAMHVRRMLWLAPIGLAHHFLVWPGDILLPLALAGLVATFLVRLDTLALIKAALFLLALQWLIDLGWTVPLFWLRDAALQPGASADAVTQWQALSDLLGGPSSRSVAAEIRFFQGNYGAILAGRLAETGRDAVNILVFQLPELLAFMAFGMAMLKGGFLSGQWSLVQYRATWRRAYLVGLLPMGALAVWVLVTADSLAAEAASFGWSVPLRLPLAAAHAALAMAIAARFGEHRLVAAIRAVGRLALSNYLLCSLAMAAIFHSYGLAMFARLDRASLLLLCIAFWIGMLAWSTAWRARWRYGPAEALWRRVVRGRA